MNQEHESDGQGFAKRLAGLLDGRNIAEFSRRIGVSPTMVKNYLEGSVPNTLVAAKIATILNVNLEWLASGRGAMRPKIEDENWPNNLQTDNDIEAIILAVMAELRGQEIENNWKPHPQKFAEMGLALFKLVRDQRQAARSQGQSVNDDPAIDAAELMKTIKRLAGDISS